MLCRKKVKNWVISTPTWYVVCEINNKTCLNKWKSHKVDIRVIFSIFFFYGVRLDPSWYDLYVQYVGRMKVKLYRKINVVLYVLDVIGMNE